MEPRAYRHGAMASDHRRGGEARRRIATDHEENHGRRPAELAWVHEGRGR
jgi:hypothetical protein